MQVNIVAIMKSITMGYLIHASTYSWIKTETINLSKPVTANNWSLHVHTTRPPRLPSKPVPI